MKPWILLAAVPLAVACTPKLDTARAAFCQELAGYVGAVNALDALTPSASIDQFRYAQAQVQAAGGRLEAAALALNQAEGTALAKTREQFAAAVGGISGNETMAQADAQINQAATRAIEQFLAIDTTLCRYGSAKAPK